MKKILNKTHGFTLIELLVVISIIGLLSSIILAALNGARQKGVQAAAFEFADNLKNVSYPTDSSTAYIYLDFNSAVTGSPPSVTSSGPIPGSAILNGSGVTFDNDTSLHGSGKYLDVGTSFETDPFEWLSSGSYVSNALKSYNFTVGFWVNMNGHTCSYTSCPMFSDNGNGVDTSIFLTNTNTLNVEYENTYVIGGTSPVPAYPFTSNGSWTYIAFSMKNNTSSATGDLYVNGKLVATNSNISISNTSPTNTIFIGGNCCENLSVAGAFYDDVLFSGVTVLSSDIKNIYALEAPAHGIALK